MCKAFYGFNDAPEAWRARLNRELLALGWRVCVVWECELRHMNALAIRVVRFLGEGFFDFDED